MRAIVIDPPAPVVTWADADKHLKLDGDTSQQAEVEAMIAAATGALDGPDGWLGRAIGVQTIEARFDRFDSCGFALPCRPIIGVTSLKYLDSAGVEQTLAADQYELIGNELIAALGATWPSAAAYPEAVRIRYQAGYATLPAPIRAAILLMTGDLYRFRETAMMVTGMKVPMSTTVENLLASYRVYG